MEQELRSLLRCPACGGALAWRVEGARCTGCQEQYPIERGVLRFVKQTDSFFEGAYARQIHYRPGRNRIKDWAFFSLVQMGVLGEIKRSLKPGGRVLEVGCAGGIRWLGEYAKTVGMDLSLTSLVEAAQCYPVAVQVKIESLPLEDSSLDLVYGSYFYEHLEVESKPRFLAEVRRVLRPGGGCVLQFDTLSNNRLIRFARRDPAAFKRGFIDNDQHLGLEPLSTALQRFQDAGLRVTRVLKFGTTAVQTFATYHWLGLSYGDKVRWVRWLDQLSQALARSRINSAVEFALTAFDRLVGPFAQLDAATRAIVVAQS